MRTPKGSQTVKCPQCGSEHLEILRRWIPLYLYKCTDCGLQFRESPYLEYGKTEPRIR